MNFYFKRSFKIVILFLWVIEGVVDVFITFDLKFKMENGKMKMQNWHKKWIL